MLPKVQEGQISNQNRHRIFLQQESNYIIFKEVSNHRLIIKSRMQPPDRNSKMASYFVSVARPQGDTRKANSPKETSLSADRIKTFKGKHTITSTE